MPNPVSPEYWDERWKFMEDNDVIVSHDELVSMIKKYVSRGTTVADFGCGYSNTLYRLKQECGCNCFGYDFSREAVRMQKNRLGIDGNITNLLHFDYNGKRFNTTILSHILEHFTNAEIDKILKVVQYMTTRQCFICVPQEKEESYNSSEIGKIIKHEHKRIFTKGELRKLLNNYFRVIEIESIKPSGSDTWEYKHHIARCLV